MRAWRADGRSVAVLAVDPSSRRSGGSLLGDRRPDRLRPARPGDVHPLHGGGRPARRPRAGDARGRPGAGRGLRRRRGRDRRRRPERDRGRRGGRHRRGHRPARLGRRPAVPEVRDHGGARRARRDEGRPRRRRACARGATCTPRCARVGRRDTAVVAVSSVAPVQGVDELVAALDAHRAGARPRPRGARPPGAPGRWPTSSPSTASAGCAPSAAGGPRRRWLAEQPPGADEAALVAALRDRAAEGAGA